ncbi:DNA-binding LacI/PurR family transcriptional regulator [Arthrobacter stackebrandtii]|uniref:DNA-binding LacI/PurR family transcriptional regulator n=1 Tax=Arthrobacter stackebrandtii TaxID=272161 RepID=A0ABS4YZC7_9MICC|nr:LacI family DNA-binding transcriptional regulator [Arthrobacter stackebrandtii]MBP2414144.1 DNA-binding LacI/PurR family transcriptional regulator [Arthrobacter stackebrandtii]PYG99319.1 LacI family transcriptional regulator [Arthrobacter stackebrandtii]
MEIAKDVGRRTAPATLQDVAARAGVSIKTVSNVVNDYTHVRATTRAKVQAAIDELKYQPNMTARSLRSGRTGVISLAVPELSLSYFAELADGVIRAAERHGLVVLIEQTGGDRDREIELLTSTRLHLSDGLIFSPLGMDSDDAHHLDVPYPMVLLGERIFGGPVDHVTMRNVEAARAATEFLISRGRKRIAVIGAHEGEVVGSAALRLQGYREALAAAGLPFDEALIGPTGLWHRHDGLVAMKAMLDRGVEFDAVFGLNDTLALGAMRVLQEARYKIPDDVFVMGFDDLDETQYSLPALTTVDPGRAEIAEMAVKVLLDRIGARGSRSQPPLQHLTEFAIRERESTG